MITNSIFYFIGALTAFTYLFRKDQQESGTEDSGRWVAGIICGVLWPLFAVAYVVSGKIDPWDGN